MKKLLFFVPLLLLGFVAPTAAQEGFTPTFIEADCPMPAPSGYVAGENLICGYVDVPELHSDPTGKTIRLTVTVIKSEGDAPDPLVMFNGGPGSDILNFLSVMTLESGASITAERDVVLMSERGSIGASPELVCPELVIVAEENFGVPLDEINALNLEAYTACHDRFVAEGVNFNAYNNPERAADVPMVMEALDYDTYNLWGVSGGGIMSLTVLRDHPEGVRTVMIDSAAFPTASIGYVFYNIYDVVSNAYRRMFEACATDPICNEAYPDLETTFWGMVDQLNAQPVPVQITNPYTGEEIEWMLDGNTIVSLLGNEMANVEILPSVITTLASGDYDYVIDRIPNLYAADLGYADALYESVVCSEISDLTQENASTAQSYPQVVEALRAQVQFHIDLCAQWGVDAVPEGDVIVSDTPILIMEGRFDSNKPPELGEVVAQDFSNSTLVMFDATAHGVFGACSLDLMGQFMNDPSQALDTSCVPTETVFAMPGTGELTFTEATLDELGVQVLLPDGWQESDAGVYTNPLDGSILVVIALPVENIDEAVDAFEAAAGLPNLDKLGDVPVGERTWAIYQAIDGETGTMLAAISHNGSTYFLGLQTAASQLEALTDSILRPMAESLIFVE
jgi:pimeloyl-ACP methyl ester carboxylesterase